MASLADSATVSYLQDWIPIEILQQIFGQLSPEDLNSVALTCRRLEGLISTDLRLWKATYMCTYGAEEPLFNPFRYRCGDPGAGTPVETLPNPWRESCRHLSYALHVRPVQCLRRRPSGSIWQFDSVHRALRMAHKVVNVPMNCHCVGMRPHFVRPHNSERRRALQILVHPGVHYVDETLHIDGDFALVGLVKADGTPAAVLSGKNRSLVVVESGAWNAYIGYLMMASYWTNGLHVPVACLRVSGVVSPLIERCSFVNDSPIGNAITVRDPGANPLIRNCCIRRSGNGLVISHHARGLYFNNVIEQHVGHGIIVRHGAKPFISQCSILHNAHNGIFVDSQAAGVIAMCMIRSNQNSGIMIQNGANPLVHHCVIQSSRCGVRIEHSGHGTLRANKIEGILSVGVMCKGADGHPLVQLNRISTSAVGVLLTHGRTARLERNEICLNEYGVVIDNSGGFVDRNAIYANRTCGVLVTPRCKKHEPAAPVLAILEGNGIRRNWNFGVLVESSAKTPLMRNNIIEANNDAAPDDDDVSHQRDVPLDFGIDEIVPEVVAPNFFVDLDAQPFAPAMAVAGAGGDDWDGDDDSGGDNDNNDGDEDEFDEELNLWDDADDGVDDVSVWDVVRMGLGTVFVGFLWIADGIVAAYQAVRNAWRSWWRRDE